MNDLIIGCSTNYNWSKLKYWINSINKSGFKGEKVLILMNCDKDTVQKIHEAGFHIVGFKQDQQGNLVYQSGIPVHVERFLHIYNFLKNKEYRYVITTDVKDVIFQKDPSLFLEENLNDKNMMFASESMRYIDEPWGNQNLLETYGNYIYDHFKYNELYNVGVLAGKSNAVRDMAINIFAASIGRPIPICDQSTFNFMISQEPYKSTSKYMCSETGWTEQLGTTADPSKIEKFRPLLLEEEPKFENNLVTTSAGTPFTIVHQYDRVPEWKKVIETIYE